MKKVEYHTKIMVSNIYFFFALFLFSFNHVISQKVRYAPRFRNVSITSETGSAYLVNMTLFQFKKEHRVSCDFNVTKNIFTKKIIVEIQRCNYEKFICENFQTWRFNENVKLIVYMKNQIWTPLIDSIAPRADLPLLKKGVYHARNATFDADKMMAFYSEAAKFYWRTDFQLYDKDDKKAMEVHSEGNVFEYVERKANPKRVKS